MSCNEATKPDQVGYWTRVSACVIRHRMAGWVPNGNEASTLSFVGSEFRMLRCCSDCRARVLNARCSTFRTPSRGQPLVNGGSEALVGAKVLCQNLLPQTASRLHISWITPSPSCVLASRSSRASERFEDNARSDRQRPHVR